jgi:hypothetical protein
MLDFLYLPIIIVLGLGFITIFQKQLSEYDVLVLRKLFFFHLILGAYYCFFNTGDAIGYWKSPKLFEFSQFKENLFNGEGTSFMLAFNYLFSNTLNMSYFSNTMVFSLFGFMGLTFFYLISIKLIPYNSKVLGYTLFPLVFFMPNMHFWSSGVGKDTTLFLCIGMFVYGMISPLKRFPLIFISGVLSMAIRPHITLFLLLGFGLAYVFGGKVPLFQRVLFSFLLFGVGLAILPSVMEFAKIEEATVDGFDRFAEAKAGVLSRENTGSAVDISSYPFPLKVFTFWFRPLFFDVRNINGLISSLENIVLLVLFVKVVKNKLLQTFRASPFIVKGLVFFLIIGTLAFSQSLGNVGIMIRMRNMFLPGMIIFILWSFSYKQELSMRDNE